MIIHIRSGGRKRRASEWRTQFRIAIDAAINQPARAQRSSDAEDIKDGEEEKKDADD